MEVAFKLQHVIQSKLKKDAYKINLMWIVYGMKVRINVFIYNVELYVEMVLWDRMKNVMMEIYYHMMGVINVKFNVSMDVIFVLKKVVWIV